MIQPGAGFNKGAARLGHFRAVHRHIAVNKQVGRLAEVAAFQHGRPEQAVEVNDIFTRKLVEQAKELAVLQEKLKSIAMEPVKISKTK